MKPSTKRNSLLCPNCRRLVSRRAPLCPTCGLKNPGSIWKDNVLTRSLGDDGDILKTIIVVNIVMYAISILIDPRLAVFSSSPLHFLSPSSNSLLVLGASGSVPLFQYDRWWSLLSANYLHGSLLHIVFNCIALYQLGPLIIREYGTQRLVTIYTLAGIGGYLISSLLGVRFTIGASASVCGLIGAALFYGKHRGGAYGKAVYSQIGGWAVGLLIFGFMVPGINNWGHVGGLGTGALLGSALGYQERSPTRLWDRFLSMGCIVGTGLVLCWSLFQGGVFVLASFG